MWASPTLVKLRPPRSIHVYYWGEPERAPHLSNGVPRNLSMYGSHYYVSYYLYFLFALKSCCIKLLCIMLAFSYISLCSQPAAWVALSLAHYVCSQARETRLYACGVGTIVVRTCMCLSVQLKFLQGICNLVLHFWICKNLAFCGLFVYFLQLSK